MSNNLDQLDLRVEIVTPENIAFQYRLAGPFRRLPAYLIDFAIRAIASAAILILFTFGFGIVGLWGVGLGITLVCWFVLDWFYGGLFETFWNGQTPGKRLMRLRVLTVEGQPINALQAVLRNVLRFADGMPLVGMMIPLHTLGLTAMMINRRYQRLGDLVCGTIVVVEERERLRGVTPVSDSRAIELAAELPANFYISRTLSHALSTYVSRRLNFTPGRRAEIARTLGEPLAERLNLPHSASHDQLLCALYFRAFIADRAEARRDRDGRQRPAEESPFRPADVLDVTADLERIIQA